MMDHKGHAKLIDFGLCKQLPPLPPTKAAAAQEPFVPTPEYKVNTKGSNANAAAPSKQQQQQKQDSEEKKDSALISDPAQTMHHLSSSPSFLGVEGYQRVPLSLTGSLIYMPPELLRDQLGGRHTDWWALGVLAHELMTGRTPWSSLSNKKVSRRALRT